MAISPQSAKAKGRRFQQWVRDRLYQTFPCFRRWRCEINKQRRWWGRYFTIALGRRLFPYSVECKNNKANAIYKVMDQAISNCPQGITPLGMVKADKRKPLAVVDADHFFELVKKHNEK